MRKRLKRCIVTISDSISPTSMPYNEFSLYRINKYKDEKQIFIVLFEKEINNKVIYPKNLPIYRVGWNMKKLRDVIRDIDTEYKSRGYDVIFHIHEGKSVIFFNLATYFKYMKRTIYTVHSTYTKYTFHNKVFSSIATFLSNKVTCVSDTSYKYFPSILKFIFPNRIVSVPNGVDIDRVNNVLSSIVEKERHIFRIIYVARFSALKRHEIIINAIKDISNVELYLIGKGECIDVIQQLVRELKIEDKVIFLGAQPRELVYKYILNSDLYVSTSSYEGLPISVLEGMACGKACLLTNIEQHEEIAKKCTSLILINDSINNWTEHIIKLMNSKDLKVIGEKNRLDVQSMFSLENMHDKYTELYNTVLDK